MSDPAKPLFNRATNGTILPARSLNHSRHLRPLQAGTISENTTMVTPAAITIGQYVFPDWKDHSYETPMLNGPWPNLTMSFSIRWRRFWQYSGLGVDRLKKYFNLFGLGSKTGIDLPSESSGLVPDPTWKKKFKGRIGISVTPITKLSARVIFWSHRFRW